jgi:acyl carrier protein
MRKTEIKRKVVNLINDWGYKEKVALNNKFIDDFGFDSLDCIDFIITVEDEFLVEVPDSDAETLKTVKDVINYLSKAI